MGGGLYLSEHPALPCRLWSMASPISPAPLPLTRSCGSWPSAPALGLSRCILCATALMDLGFVLALRVVLGLLTSLSPALLRP